MGALGELLFYMSLRQHEPADAIDTIGREAGASLEEPRSERG